MIRKMLLLAVFTQMLQFGFGQATSIAFCDSILSQEPLSSVDLDRLDSTIYTLNFYLSDDPISLYQRSRTKATKYGLIRYAAKMELRMAEIYWELLFVDSAQYYADHAAWVYQELGDQMEYARTANIRRLVYTRKSDFSKALDICFEALNIFTDNEDPTGIAITNRDIGSIMLQENKYPDALEYCLKSIEQLEIDKNWLELSFSYQRTAIVYRELGQFTKALELVQKSINACYKVKGFRCQAGLAAKYWTRGYIHEAMGNFPIAIVDYDSAKYFAQKVDYPVDIWVHNSVGGIYLKQNRYREALDEFEKTKSIITNENILLSPYNFFLPLYTNLAEAYAGLGQFKQAYEYTRDYSLAKDSIFKLETEKQIAEVRTKFETSQKESTIQKLKADRLVQRKILILGIFLLFSMIVTAMLLWRNNRYRLNVNKTLEKQKQVIESKNAQNELLMKEIHHRVKNNLQTISSLLYLQSKNISDQSVKQAIQASQNRVNTMALIHQKLYQGKNLEKIEIKDYLQNLGRELVITSGKEDQGIRFDYDMEPMELNIDIAIPIGLIVNELITNSLKHAFPKGTPGKIKISVNNDNRQHEVELMYQDNGIGKNNQNTDKSFSFGSQLISLLCSQLKGRQKEELIAQGYQTRISFPLN